ncbi:protein dispatched [Cimex lectularius]|uniref:SSD domain-containing protein n=1 Tax=Cimex lectularius TaxID=79782 RepID=A0A8I6RTJ7_CIMLE|nr:protein dispatched [Cimex lectularius]
MSWFARVLAHHPYVVLIAVAVFSSTCVIIPLTTLKLPNFKDPQLGFEARGTVIGQRLTAWDNLQEAIRPSGLLTIKPNIPDSIPRKNKGAEVPQIKTSNISLLNDLVDKHPNISIEIEPEIHRNLTEDSDEEREAWFDIMNPTSHHHHNHLGPDSFFCTEPNTENGRMVFSSVSGTDLFQLGPLLDMCKFSEILTSGPEYNQICDQVSTRTRKCCPLWSLPNYVAVINNKTSCFNITEEDVFYTKDLIKRCQKYFISLDYIVPNYSNKEMPSECTKFNHIFSLIHYILDYEYSSKSEILKDVMVFLPIARSTVILDYYHSIESLGYYKNIRISAIDFGLKNTLFDECLVKDMRLVACGATFVLLSMWLYTGSFFITIMTLIAIAFSLGISYFVYMLIFEFKFFPFMNLLASVVAIGIGGDTSLMVFKLWSCARESQSNISKLVQSVHGHSTVCMLVTSLTTAIAFYSSYISNITAICCFSVFAGTAVVANFFVMLAWIPSSLVVAERLTVPPVCPPSMRKIFDGWSKILHGLLVELVLKLRWLWIMLLGSVAVLSIPVVFYYPKLRLPDSPDLQLFSSDHLFEQYDMVYKERFWFDRIQKFDNLRNSRVQMPVRFIWGVLPVDNGNYMDPASKGKLVFDSSFDLSSPDSQTWLLSFCTKLRAQPFYQQTMGPLLPNCFLEVFVKWMDRKCIDAADGLTREPCCESARFPYSKKVFSLCLAKAWISLYNTPVELSMLGVAGPKFAMKTKTGIPKVKALVVEYDANFTLSTSFIDMNHFYQQVETWSRNELASAPAGMRNGWFISYLGLYDLQQSLAKDTILAVLISMGASFFVVTLSTLNFILSIVAVLTITSIILVTIAILVLIGWKLNILEAVAVSLAIGLAVDFTMHYIVNYRMAPESDNKENSVIYSLSMMGGPTLMAALTTIIAGAFMLPSSVLAYTQIGIFLVVVMCVSWIYATLFLLSILTLAGPEAPRRVNQREQHELGALSRVWRRAEHSPSAASATTIIHDEECEISVIQPNPP